MFRIMVAARRRQWSAQVGALKQTPVEAYSGMLIPQANRSGAV